MRNLLQIAQGLNVLPLHNALLRNPSLWNRYPERNTGPHSDVDDVWVRCNSRRNFDKAHPEKFMAEHDSVWYPEYHDLKMVDDLIFPLMSSVRADRLGGVLITRVPAGKEVKPHVDGNWHANYYDKYAIQVAAHPEQKWNNEDGEFVSKPGDVYWFNNQATHWVTNPSPVDRITLIVCLHHSKSTK